MGQGPSQLDVADSAGWGRDRVRWRWLTALGGGEGQGPSQLDMADSAGWGRDRSS